MGWQLGLSGDFLGMALERGNKSELVETSLPHPRLGIGVLRPQEEGRPGLS